MSSNIKQSLQNDTIKGFFWLFTGSGSQAIIRIITLSILARLITPYEFGIIGAALIIIGFSRMISQMGVGPALVQRSNITKRHIRTSFTSSLVLGVFIAIFLIIVSPYIAAFFGMAELNKVLHIIALVFVVDSFSIVSLSLLQREMSFKWISLVNVVSYILGYGLIGVLFAFLNYGIWALVYAQIVQAILKAIFFSYLKPHSIIPYWDKQSFSELISFGGGFTVSKIANYFALQGDNIIAGKLLGAEALGLYSRAYQLLATPSNLIGQSLNDALFPAMSSVKTNKKKLKKAYLKTIELVSLISIPGSFVIIFNAKGIVLILLGHNWLSVIPIVQILGASILFRMGYKISDSLIKSIGAVNSGAVLQIIYAIAIFTGAGIGQYWGLSGLAVGVSLAIMTNYFLMALLSIKRLNIQFLEFINCHTYGLIIGGIIALISYLLQLFLSKNINSVVWGELLFITIILISYFLLLIYFRNRLSIKNNINNFLRLVNR